MIQTAQDWDWSKPMPLGMINTGIGSAPAPGTVKAPALPATTLPLVDTTANINGAGTTQPPPDAAYAAWKAKGDEWTARGKAANFTGSNDPRLAAFQAEGDAISKEGQANSGAWAQYMQPGVVAKPGSTGTTQPPPGATGTLSGMIGAATQQVAQQATTSTNANGVTTVNAAPNVVAQTGTPNTYQATNAAGAADVVAGMAGAGTAVGTQAQINPATDTVQGRVSGVIDENSPLTQRAIQIANERSNARGMINSSQGVGAAQAALYDAALPIATADAAAYNQQRLANQAATNRASEVNATLYTDVSKFNTNAALQAGIVNQDQANRIEQFNATSANQASQFNAASAQDMAKFNIDNLLKAGIINQDQANRMSQFNAEQINAMSRLDADIAARLQGANISASATLGAAQIGADTSRANATLSAATQTGIAKLDADTRTTLAGIDSANRELLNTNSNAAAIYQTGMNNIAGLANNNNMDPTARADAVKNQIDVVNYGLKLIGYSGTLDLGNLDFSGDGP